jgi:Raf kinase inhibitor-like YbhB/YbcL family protein
MKIESSAFQNQQPIPRKYTCEGTDVSPPLTFSGIPAGTQSLALIVDDPDAPMGTFDHWIVWDIPANSTALAEGARVPKQGTNHFREKRYRGPCPPPGKPHRYFFKLYALDTMLDLEEGASKEELEASIKGHILGKAELIGTYQRK